MDLQFDTSVPYALALEGGGAKGSYQIGAWKALRESGLQICAVSGTSVGALNGALIAMGDLEKAQRIWENIRYSQVMDVDDDMVRKLIRGDLRELDLRAAAEALKVILSNHGLDVAPLYEWIHSVVDEDAIRASEVELFIVTFSVREQKELELRARDLPVGTLHDMLLASAYLPVFHSDRLSGKFADGGVRDVLPIHVLLENGYRNIIALRLFGFGLERRIRIPKSAHVLTVAPTGSLGSTLEFTPERSRFNMLAGYYDTQRMLYGLKGSGMYIDALWPETTAYEYLMSTVSGALAQRGQNTSLRSIHESVFPRLAKALSVRGDYRDLAAAFLEAAAVENGIDRWCIYTEDDLSAILGPAPCPSCLTSVLEPRRGLSLPIRL